MKILQVIDSLPTGGGARFVVDFVLELNNKGIQSDVLLLDGQETDFYKELKKSKVCTIHALTIGNRWNYRNIKKLIPYFSQYDLVHVHIFPASYFVAFAKFFSKSKTPVVFTEHNSQNRRAKNKLFRYVEKFIYSQFEMVVCLTEDVKAFVKKNLKIQNHKLSVIENGINLQKINDALPYDRDKWGYMKEDKLLLMSARFESQKDHDTMIAAFKFLPYNFKLILAGEGSTWSHYKELVNKENLEGRVAFIGNRQDIFNIMKMVDYNVLSSHFEGFSLSALEGLSAGKPFIASNVSGLNFIKNYGLLFEKGNAEQLAKLILELDEQEEWYKETVNKCLLLSKEFSISKMTNQYIDVYKRIISK